MGAVNSCAMPFSNVSHLHFEEKLRATQLAGWSEMSIMPIQVQQIVARGMSIPTMLLMAADYGVRISRLDPLNTWTRIWLPDNMDDEYVATVDTRADVFFALTDALGCSHMSLNATFPLNAMPFDEIVEHYVAIGERAKEHGLICDLEPIPLWGVPTLAMGWDIVREAGASNGGIVFDTWHFVRSKSSLDTLREIPCDQIHCVQLSDGPVELPAGVTIKENCYDRLFPGDGEFPNAEVVQILAEKGALNELGPEVFSPMLNDMTTEQVAKKSAASIERTLEAAGVAA